jgi:protein-L-isoaspartate(D-aspartate) O-methyltransferase
MKERDDDLILRNEMVEGQLIPRGIMDAAVLTAMRKVPRHLFTSGKSLENSYADYPLPVGEGQTISQPYMVALMTQCLELKGGGKVLEIGTGSGYQAAILREIAAEVYSVERYDTLAQKARELLDGLGYKDIKIKVGDGTEGWDEFAPYDGIIVTAGAPSVPAPLVEQLAEGGIMVIPVGGAFSQELLLIRKNQGEITQEIICGCTFVPLVGKYGWQE